MMGVDKEQYKEMERQRRVNPAIGFGSSFAAGMLIFSLGGRWIDNKYGHDRLFTLIGIGLGLLYGAWELWKLIMITGRRDNQKEDANS